VHRCWRESWNELKVTSLTRDDDVARRVALVTGAARGIGAATVARLCTDGYNVTAVDAFQGDDTPTGVAYPLATSTDLETLTDRFPGRLHVVEADVRDRDALDRAVTETNERFGALHAVVAAAGVIAGGLPQWETPDPHLDTLLDVNVRGVWNIAAATIPTMLAGAIPNASRFVAIASAAGERGLFRLAAYTASKHAVIGIVRGLAADLVGTGLTAVAVCPGSTRTAMLQATAELYGVTAVELASHQAIGRLLEPEEIAATIALCCSPDGAALNGSVIRVDGGFTA
jgi:SDR family mycofactocin-dependent oxidoreductase